MPENVKAPMQEMTEEVKVDDGGTGGGEVQARPGPAPKSTVKGTAEVQPEPTGGDQDEPDVNTWSTGSGGGVSGGNGG